MLAIIWILSKLFLTFEVLSALSAWKVSTKVWKRETLWKKLKVCTREIKKTDNEFNFMKLFSRNHLSISLKFSLHSYSFKFITMLQKLSKCEIKAWLCWNLIILRFYVKSNFDEFEQSKNVNFDNFRGSEFWFLVNLSNFQVLNLLKFKVQSLQNCQNWISRKIAVVVKWSKASLNFTFLKFLEHSGVGER